MENIVLCACCKESKFKTYAQVPDRHYGIKGEYTMSQCVNCSLVFMNPMPNFVELGNFYPEESYYSFHIDIYRQKSEIKQIVKKILFLDDSVKEPNFSKPGKILDIGCGNGWNLFQFKKNGWEVYGVEPGKAGSDIGNKANLNIFNGDLLSAKYDNNHFDYIRSNHSFEHIHNPNEILTEINRILKKDGQLLIGVPNVNGLMSKLFKQFWYYLGAPIHTFNYCPKTIDIILQNNNFEVKQIRYSSSWAGILGSIQIYLNKETDKNSSTGFVFNFMPFKIMAGFIAKILNLLKLGDCMEIIAVKNKH